MKRTKLFCCLALFFLLLALPSVFSQEADIKDTGGVFSETEPVTSTVPGACVPGWKCKDSTTRAYQDAKCNWSSEENCQHGCVGGVCNVVPAGCIESWIGSPYCKNSDVWQKYKNANCSEEEKLKQECGSQECEAGACKTAGGPSPEKPCSPSISGIEGLQGGKIVLNTKPKVKVELGDCKASKIVLSVFSRKVQEDPYNIYWIALGYPVMREVFNYPEGEEFATIKAAVDKIKATAYASATRPTDQEPFYFTNFKEYVVDAVVMSGGSGFTGTAEVSLDFSEAALDEIFKKKRAWIKSRQSEFTGAFPTVAGTDISDIDASLGFFEVTRALDSKFADGILFKAEVKDKSDNSWKISPYFQVGFEDNPAVGPFCKDPNTAAVRNPDGSITGEKNCPHGCNANTGQCNPAPCTPNDCQAQGWGCGSGTESKCGQPLDCGACPGTDETCVDHKCVKQQPGRSESETQPSDMEKPPTDSKVPGGGPITDSGGSQTGDTCFIRIEAEFNGTAYDSSKKVSVDSSSVDSISVKGRFSLSQEGCAIQAGAEYGFWANSSFSGTRQGGGTLTAEQASKMNNKETVEIPNITLSGIKGFNGSKFFGMKGQVKPNGATSFSDKSSASIEFQFGAGGTIVLPGETKCSDGTEQGKCSSTKPKYCCKEGDTEAVCSGQPAKTLVDNCKKCGCPANHECLPNGACKAIEALEGCDPCQSVVGCLACIDKTMAEQTLK